MLLNDGGQSARPAVFNYIREDLTAYRVGPYEQHFALLITTGYMREYLARHRASISGR